MFDTNVGLIARTLAELLARGVVADGARLVVLSSIWQAIARSNKFSYTVSKAALGGLVRAAAADLAAERHPRQRRAAGGRRYADDPGEPAPSEQVATIQSETPVPDVS